MKIIPGENIEIKDIETSLKQILAGRKAKIKLDKETLSVSLDYFRGAMVRIYKSKGIKKIEVIAHMPAEAPLEIASAIIAFVIYQSMGRWYGMPAIVIAIGWPILLGMLVSRKFANEVAEIVSNTSIGKEAVETEQKPERNEVKVSPKAKLKACPNCGNPIRLASDLNCRKCGQRL